MFAVSPFEVIYKIKKNQPPWPMAAAWPLPAAFRESRGLSAVGHGGWTPIAVAHGHRAPRRLVVKSDKFRNGHLILQNN
jgi:hypothetical protein